MNSKEALERLLKIACVEPGPAKVKFITIERKITHNKKCLDLYETIKQDLDKIEKLEKVIEILRTKEVSILWLFYCINLYIKILETFLLY